MKENFPNLAKQIDFKEVQEAQRVPKKLDPRRNTPRHIIITLPKIKDKEKVLKETLQTRRDWKEVFQVMKGKTYVQDCSIQQRFHLE